MLWEFGSEKNLVKLLAYEVALEALLEREPALCGICQYHRDLLPASAMQVALYTHQAIYVNEMLPRLNPYYREVGSLRNVAGSEASRIRHMLDRLRA